MPNDSNQVTKVCTIKSLPAHLAVPAADTAIRMNALNARPLHLLNTRFADLKVPVERLAVLVAKYWGNGGVRLTVSFLDGPPADLRARILLHMNAWGRYANVAFVETGAGGQVRISRVAGDGYWSYLGTDILSVNPTATTMNLDSFTMNTADSEFFRVVRHETGHTLGFPHEHTRTEIVDRIDRAKAISFFQQYDGWSEQETIQQVLTPLDYSALEATAHADPNSIMCYWLPAEIMTDNVAVTGGIDIDTSDGRFAGITYPLIPIPTHQWGTAGDIAVARDYDGDGRADFAVWRPNEGNWYILLSSRNYDTGNPVVKQWGTSGDIPVPADYDGDGKADIAIWRPHEGGWYLLFSSSGYDYNKALIKQYGTYGDVPVPADYDGDGRADIAVWRPSDGGWYILFSSLNYDYGRSLVKQYGTAGDIPVPADYDGDGKADLAIWRPSDGGWYILHSSAGYDTGRQFVKQWGTAGDVPIPFDYDGDGKADLAVWRPSEGKLYVLLSSTNYNTGLAATWLVGSSGATVTPIDYDGDGHQDLAVWRPGDGRWSVERL